MLARRRAMEDVQVVVWRHVGIKIAQHVRKGAVAPRLHNHHGTPGAAGRHGGGGRKLPGCCLAALLPESMPACSAADIPSRRTPTPHSLGSACRLEASGSAERPAQGSEEIILVFGAAWPCARHARFAQFAHLRQPTELPRLPASRPACGPWPCLPSQHPQLEKLACNMRTACGGGGAGGEWRWQQRSAAASCIRLPAWPAT